MQTVHQQALEAPTRLNWLQYFLLISNKEDIHEMSDPNNSAWI